MGTLTTFAEFQTRRTQKMIASVMTTPAQRAKETMLRNDGFTFKRTTPAGCLLYTRKEADHTLTALINSEGDITYRKWTEED